MRHDGLRLVLSANTRWQRARRHGLGQVEGLLLPDALTRACASALPVDGAGLSCTLLPDRRVPLGASSPMAAAAERLQFTLGDGPCVWAQRSRSTVAASLVELADRWPVYTEELTRLTDYKSVVASPVGGPLAGAVALEIYLFDDRTPTDALIEDLTLIAGHVGHELADGIVVDPDHRMGIPGAFRTPPAATRHQVWLALGRLNGEHAITDDTSLALLRGLAFSLELDLDTAAERILDGTLDVTHLDTPPGKGS